MMTSKDFAALLLRTTGPFQIYINMVKQKAVKSASSMLYESLYLDKWMQTKLGNKCKNK